MFSKCTTSFSNLNASKKNYEFDGKQMLEHAFIPCGTGNMSLGTCICSVGDRMAFSIAGDLGIMKDYQRFADLYAEINREVLVKAGLLQETEIKD